MTEEQTKYFYQIAIDSRGQIYLEAEEQLVELGDSAAPFLEAQSQLSAGLPRLVTNVLLEHIRGNQDFKEALEYFDRAEQRAAATPMRTPPPDGVAEYLFQHFADRVSSLLGVYLVKLAAVWPQWKIFGVILYLGKLSSDVSADPLIQFISSTGNEHHRTVALSTLTSIADATTLVKIEESLKSVEGAQQALTQAANEIRSKLNP